MLPREEAFRGEPPRQQIFVVLSRWSVYNGEEIPAVTRKSRKPNGIRSKAGAGQVPKMRNSSQTRQNPLSEMRRPDSGGGRRQRA